MKLLSVDTTVKLLSVDTTVKLISVDTTVKLISVDTTVKLISVDTTMTTYLLARSRLPNPCMFVISLHHKHSNANSHSPTSILIKKCLNYPLM